MGTYTRRTGVGQPWLKRLRSALSARAVRVPDVPLKDTSACAMHVYRTGPALAPGCSAHEGSEAMHRAIRPHTPCEGMDGLAMEREAEGIRTRCGDAHGVPLAARRVGKGVRCVGRLRCANEEAPSDRGALRCPDAVWQACACAGRMGGAYRREGEGTAKGQASRGVHGQQTGDTRMDSVGRMATRATAAAMLDAPHRQPVVQLQDGPGGAPR